MQVVLLGSAPDPRIQNDFVSLANQLHSSHNDRARLCLAYDEPLSHLVMKLILRQHFIHYYIYTGKKLRDVTDSSRFNLF